MESQMCEYCSDPATYTCTCTKPSSSFCKQHRDDHESIFGDHVIKLLSRSSNPEVKSKLIQALSDIKDQGSSKKQDVINYTEQAILSVLSQSTRVLTQLDNFITLCEDLIKDLINCNALTSKQIYPPLEAAIFSKNIDSILSEIYSPQIIFHDLHPSFTYIPPTFFHTLFSYSTCSISYRQDSLLYVYTPNKTFVKEKLHPATRSLLLSPTKLLITGDGLPGQKSIILDTVSEEIVELPSLKVPKRGYAMAWIDGFPGIIGGRINNLNVKGVEIYKENKVVQVASLKFARRGHSACSYRTDVWVFGGITDSGERMDSIERYQNKEWNIVEARMLVPCANPGLLCFGNEIVILGGLGENDKEICEVGVYEVDRDSVRRTNTLEKELSFAQNLFYVRAQQVTFISKKGTEEKINLETIFNSSSKP